MQETTLDYVRLRVPPAEQLAILHAAVLDWPQAKAAWEEWRAAHDIQDIDLFSVSRLLPYIYSRFTSEGHNDPDQQLLRGSYQRIFYQNNLRFYRLADLLRRCQAEGIEVIILKGSYLSLRFYPDPSARPMLDLDLMVRSADVLRLHKILGEGGWRVTPVWYQEGAEDDIERFVHRKGSLGYSEESGLYDVDVHVDLFSGQSSKSFREYIWESRTPFSVLDAPCSVLSDEAVFLHCVVHGLKFNTLQASRLYWILDAVQILSETKDTLDWELIVELARSEYQLRRLREAVIILQRDARVELPAAFLSRLSESKLRLVERLEAYYDRVGSSGPFGGLPTRIAHYVRNNRLGNPYRTPLLEWLADIWELENRRSLLRAIPLKLLEILRRR